MGDPRAPQRPDQGDLRQLIRRVGRPADVVIGVGLLMALFFSFADAWFRVDYGIGVTVTLGSLWGGVGYLAGLLLLLVAIPYWVATTFFGKVIRLPELPLAMGREWVAFGVLEAGLMGLFFFFHRTSSEFGLNPAPTAITLGVGVTPGWAWYCGLASAGVIALGGRIKAGTHVSAKQSPVEPLPKATVDRYTPKIPKQLDKPIGDAEPETPEPIVLTVAAEALSETPDFAPMAPPPERQPRTPPDHVAAEFTPAVEPGTRPHHVPAPAAPDPIAPDSEPAPTVIPSSPDVNAGWRANPNEHQPASAAPPEPPPS